MPSLGLSINLQGADSLSYALSAAPDAVRQRLASTMQDALLDLANLIRANVNGGVMDSRSGTLARSIQERGVEVQDNAIIGRVGSEGVPYANIQEFGGTIHARNVSFLTIPLDAMKTQTGSRGTAREVINSPQAFGFQGTFFANGVLFGRNAQGITPLFALKESVTLPARHYFGSALTAFEPDFRERMQNSLAQALNDLQGSAT